MSLDWLEGRVVRIIHETPTIRRYFIQAESMPVFDFKPGQFVTLDLPIHEKKNKRWRSYSIASAPDGTNIFELVIVLVEDGLGTPFLWTNVKEGDILTFRGPAGVFVLHEPVDYPLFLICTGTGIAPFRSMVLYRVHQKLPLEDIYLIFGTRTQQDLLYYQELKQLSEQIPGFHYLPVLSRENWSGRTGYVHEVYQELALHKPEARFMLCGWKNMIDDARKNLESMGFDKKQIHFELYG